MDGEEALIAAKKGDLAKLKKLLDKGSINVNAKDAKGESLLHHATSSGQHDVVEYLLLNGANVHETSDNNGTALHIAVAKGEAVVAIILENTARNELRRLLETRDKEGSTALHVAVRLGMQTAFLLLLYGAVYESKNNAGEKPADLARDKTLREVFVTIDGCFALAKNGRGERRLAEWVGCGLEFSMTCRNGEGHTLVQTLVLTERYKSACDLIGRANHQTTATIGTLTNPKNKKKIEQLAKLIVEYLKFELQQKIAMMKLASSPPVMEDPPGSNCYKFVDIPAGKIVSCVNLAGQVLERARKVLLEYQAVEGQKKKPMNNLAMKILEETLEVLGLDSRELRVVADQKSSYYQKLPANYRNNIALLMNVMNYPINGSIMYLLGCIYTTQIIDAVKMNDLEKVQYLISKDGDIQFYDLDNRSALCYAIDGGSKKMIRLLLKSGAILVPNNNGVLAERGLFLARELTHGLSSICLAIDNGNAKILTMILKSVEPKNVPEVIDWRLDCGSTALHEAARRGRLDYVKLLLRYGATYCVINKEDDTPVNVSSSEEVSDFFNLVDEFFHRAKEGNDDLVFKLKAMDKSEFRAVAGARNLEGETLAVVAAKANAKSLAGMILRMIREVNQKKK